MAQKKAHQKVNIYKDLQIASERLRHLDLLIKWIQEGIDRIKDGQVVYSSIYIRERNEHDDSLTFQKQRIDLDFMGRYDPDSVSEMNVVQIPDTDQFTLKGVELQPDAIQFALEENAKRYKKEKSFLIQKISELSSRLNGEKPPKTD